jgi:protein-S-isoprenylcysteine O-methyltransferase Ste14/membrane-associated phospholipid phosphatase
VTYRKLISKLSLCRKDVFFLVFILVIGLIALWSYFNLDQQVFSLLRQNPINWHSNYWIKAFRYLGRAWLPIWLLLVWYLATGRQRPILITLIALIIVGLIVTSLKVGVRRPRPREVIKTQLGQEEQPNLSYHLSFPSGDAAVVFAVAAVIASFVTWPLACLLLAASTGIALLRVTVMAHYPSDALAGAAIGVFAGWLAVQIERRWFSLLQLRFNLSRGIAILGIIAIPLSFGLYNGFDKLVTFLKTYGLLAVCIFLTIGASELFKKTNAITKLASSERFEYILNWLRKRRTLALKIAFPIIIAENIIDGEKPHELEFPDISVMIIISIMLVLAGALIRFWAHGHFRKDRLVTTGPYALLRHPVYLGSLLVITGVLIQLQDRFFNFGVIIPLIVVFYGAAIIFEEKSLEKRFGIQWQLYKSEVPCIIPSLRSWLLPRHNRKWSWKTYLRTGEIWVTPLLISLPLLIELMENLVFERMFGIP